MNPQDEIRSLKPTKDYFIGIDSDGCVFDTMEIKQKECFCPNFIREFRMQPIARYARETWEFVNLYSKFRGVNRFIALVEAMNYLSERPEVAARGISLPDMTALKEWISKETKLGNPTLEEYVKNHPAPILEVALKWSKLVNSDIAKTVYGIGPFPFVREALDIIKEKADAIVVSQTPLEALKREWEENKLIHYMRFIAGQEYGTKAEHIALAAGGKYPNDHILMIGDALGDLKAAKKNNVLFFPVNPGHEEESWEKLYKEGLNRFFSGTYAGAYEEKLINDFKVYLPENPQWKRK